MGFGPHAIVVAGGAGKLNRERRPVVSSAREEIGLLTDIEFNEVTGSLQSLVIGESSHDASRLMAVGPYSRIVDVDDPDAAAVSTSEVLAG